MTLLEDIRKSLRIASDAFDAEVEMLARSALADMGRAGVNPSLLSVDPEDGVENPMVMTAVTAYCKANFGYDNPEADRFMGVYDRILWGLLNSSENVAAIALEPADEPSAETAEPEDDTDYSSKFYGLSPSEVWASLSYRPTKAEYRQACDWLGVEYPEDATNVQLRALLAEACGVSG